MLGTEVQQRPGTEHSPHGGAALGKVEMGQSYQKALPRKLHFWGLCDGV